MRSLFLRIFLWFWVAMAAVATVLVVSSPFFTRARPALERWQHSSERFLGARLAEASERVARGELGPVPPPSPPPRDRDGARHVTILTRDGVAVDGGAVPADLAAFARRVAAAGEDRSERAGAFHLAGRPAKAPDGTEYVVVASVRRPPSLVDLLEPGVLAPRLLLLTLLAGLICLGLARHLTAPVASLRGTVRRLAGGDLAARAAPAVGARRDEIGDLARDFDGMAGKLETLVGAQRRLVRDVSHELRSPLSRLGVALELARQRGGAGAREPLDRIEREAARLDELVGQLLTLSRLEAGEQIAVRQPLDLSRIAAEVTGDAAFEAQARGVAVRLEAPASLPFEGDEALLRSALDNVVRNGVRFTAPGTAVTTAAAAEAGGVTLTVRDHGPGVPADQLEKVFEPFFRSSEARDRDSGGVGLGLAIAAGAVRAHRGTISARNADDGGLVVTIRLPAAGAATAP
jgi:two-component system sensor histidine kinase CpxA